MLRCLSFPIDCLSVEINNFLMFDDTFKVVISLKPLVKQVAERGHGTAGLVCSLSHEGPHRLASVVKDL